MTVKKNFKNLKDKLKDDTLDLSLSDLEEVPVQEIAAVKKASHLDLSNNLLTTLPKNFVILKQIVKLDLSKNMLTEIPENFGEMTQLKYLDLYANQISRLPLSLSELKNLRWLDLKENPLTPAVASVAGPCSNADECKACARNVVEYLSNVKLTIGEEKLRRMNVVAGEVPSSKNPDPTKKETKKKKKKKQTDKEHDKNMEKTERQVQNETSQRLRNKVVSVQMSQSPKTTQCISAALCGVLTSVFLWSIFLVLFSLSFILFLPLYDKELSHVLSDYIEKHTGILIETYQRYSMEALQFAGQTISTWLNHVYKVVNDIYNSAVSKLT